MGKKKKKDKKISAKKEKYLKFKRDKPSVLNLTMPELTQEQQKQKQEDERKIEGFLKFNRNRPNLDLKDRKKLKGKAKYQ